MPGGICGTWPGFWMVGPDWPNQGEIDIIEGVNDQQSNDITLHTGPGCSINDNSELLGSLVSTSCASNTEYNEGCKISTRNAVTYGTTFNSRGRKRTPSQNTAVPVCSELSMTTSGDRP